MLTYIEQALHKYAHVSISAREGNNRMEVPFVTCSRPLRAMAFRRKEFLQCEHGRVDVMEDFDVTLQLLRKGYQNMVITAYANDQRMTQMAGGCSDYRTHAVHEASAKKLAKLHPEFVKLRTKENKTGGEFAKRTEVTISWKAAYESAWS
jgi:hypothetical protein